MPWGLEEDYVLFDDKEFATRKDTNSGKHYFEDRVELKGVLSFGTVQKNQEVFMSLADNNIESELLIDSIVALSDSTTSDEIEFNLYTMVDGVRTLLGQQRYSNAQMPVEFPDAVLFPDMIIGVTPKKADSLIAVYVKPVSVLFYANQVTTA